MSSERLKLLDMISFTLIFSLEKFDKISWLSGSYTALIRALAAKLEYMNRHRKKVKKRTMGKNRWNISDTPVAATTETTTWTRHVVRDMVKERRREICSVAGRWSDSSAHAYQTPNNKKYSASLLALFRIFLFCFDFVWNNRGNFNKFLNSATPKTQEREKSHKVYFLSNKLLSCLWFHDFPTELCS